MGIDFKMLIIKITFSKSLEELEVLKFNKFNNNTIHKISNLYIIFKHDTNDY